jgi:hypothetical protein
MCPAMLCKKSRAPPKKSVDTPTAAVIAFLKSRVFIIERTLYNEKKEKGVSGEYE